MTWSAWLIAGFLAAQQDVSTRQFSRFSTASGLSECPDSVIVRGSE